MHIVPVHEWWDAMGGGAKALQTIARCILAQVCSASACECNWSMYSFVHNIAVLRTWSTYIPIVGSSDIVGAQLLFNGMD